MAELVFNIATGKLSGTIGDYSFDVYAWSGGRGGSKTKNAAHPILVNNPFFTKLKLKGHSDNDYAGSLPMGFYSLKLHETRQNWIRLNPAKNNYMYKRDGFAIHARGPRGSDGCIVLSDFEILKKLCSILKENEAQGKQLVLEVKAIGDIDYILNNTEKYSRTA